MKSFSRRTIIASLGAAGTSLLCNNLRASVKADSVQHPPNAELYNTPNARKADADRLFIYFSKHAPDLLRSSGPLRFPTIAHSLPRAAYSGQLWDWDTLWTCRAMFRLAHRMSSDDRSKVVEHAKGSLLVFLTSQSEEGRIPIMVGGNGADFFGSLAKVRPKQNNQAKPVFGQLALLISDEVGDVEWFRMWFDHLIRFYNSWFVDNRSAVGLMVWGNDVAVGVDNDPTVFGRPLLSSGHLLLNCLFYQDLGAAAEMARRLQRSEDHKRLSAMAQQLGSDLQQYCWDPRDRFYYTVDVQCADDRSEMNPNVPLGMPMSWKCLPLRIQTFGGFLPMWCGFATRQQANDLVKLHLLNSQTFGAAWGVRSLSAQETMYSLARSANPSNWLGPVWILANYLVWKGLTNYGFEAEANALRDKTLRLLANDLSDSGSLNEYYHPDTGSPLSVSGFIDWNMLILEMI